MTLFGHFSLFYITWLATFSS